MHTTNLKSKCEFEKLYITFELFLAIDYPTRQFKKKKFNILVCIIIYMHSLYYNQIHRLKKHNGLVIFTFCLTLLYNPCFYMDVDDIIFNFALYHALLFKLVVWKS